MTACLAYNTKHPMTIFLSVFCNVLVAAIPVYTVLIMFRQALGKSKTLSISLPAEGHNVIS
jgi:hypothetical protein